MSPNFLRRGTLLIDFIAATAVFLLVTSIFYTICSTKDRTLNDTEILAHATSAANARMEALRALPYDELSKWNGTTFPIAELKDPGETPGKVAIREFEPGLTQITVTVTWTKRVGTSENIQLSTLVRNEGVWR